MTRTGRILTTLYGYLLRLYPSGFRAEFADEMRGVFADAMRDAVAAGSWPVMHLILRELASLPASLVQASRLYPSRSIYADKLSRARWSARYFSIFWGGYMLTLAVQRTLDSGDLTVLRAVQMVPSLTLVLAWRWERTGGMLTMLGGAVLCGLGAIGGYNATQGEPLLTQLAIMFTGLMWGTAYLVFGGLYVWVANKARAAEAAHTN